MHLFWNNWICKSYEALFNLIKNSREWRMMTLKASTSVPSPTALVQQERSHECQGPVQCSMLSRRGGAGLEGFLSSLASWGGKKLEKSRAGEVEGLGENVVTYSPPVMYGWGLDTCQLVLPHPTLHLYKFCYVIMCHQISFPKNLVKLKFFIPDFY